MEIEKITQLLAPFLDKPLSPAQAQSISMYIDILLRWNSRINLTAVRGPEQIVTRHFGESLFAVRHLFPEARPVNRKPVHLIDVGSGAGFPGLPIKIWTPTMRLTLIESNQKKAAFLREVVRTLVLREVEVFNGRAEDYGGARADVVTLRAVERFESVLPIAARVVSASGQLALLIGVSQVDRVAEVLPDFCWTTPLPIPLAASRVVLVGARSRTDVPRGTSSPNP